MSKKVLGIIDAQRGFMPAIEGQRLAHAGERFNNDGFGELPVPGGEEIVDPVNALLAAFDNRGFGRFTTQDWHPKETAHFSQEPNFTTTWPVHCVAFTPGAELHPSIKTAGTTRFLKGHEALTRGEDDTSYSGYYATTGAGTGMNMREYFENQGAEEVTLGGLALDYCVRKSALDFRQKLGLEVIVAVDATRGIADESIQETLREFEKAGIRTATNEEILAGL